MELISRMMDGSVSYDGEHRLEPVLSRDAVRDDLSRFKAVPIFAGCTEKQLRHVANIARIFDAPAQSTSTRTVPSRMRKNSSPGSPARVSTD